MTTEIIRPNIFDKMMTENNKAYKEEQQIKKFVYTEEIINYFENADEMCIFFQGCFNIFEARMFASDSPLVKLYEKDIGLHAFKKACIIANDGLIDITCVPDRDLFYSCLIDCMMENEGL